MQRIAFTLVRRPKCDTTEIVCSSSILNIIYALFKWIEGCVCWLYLRQIFPNGSFVDTEYVLPFLSADCKLRYHTHISFCWTSHATRKALRRRRHSSFDMWLFTKVCSVRSIYWSITRIPALPWFLYRATRDVRWYSSRWNQDGHPNFATRIPPYPFK